MLHDARERSRDFPLWLARDPLAWPHRGVVPVRTWISGSDVGVPRVPAAGSMRPAGEREMRMDEM